MEQLKTALCALTHIICRDLEEQAIPKKPVWTVVNPPGAAPHVALDPERLALSELRSSLSIGLLRLPEYGVAAKAIENDPELREGIIVDAGGFLRKPHRDNLTRMLLTNFLWRYLQEGARLDWDETRFAETFDELRDEVRRKSVVFHTTMPLSNMKMDITALDFNDELKLLPASIEELERWMNRDRNLLFPGAGPPSWNVYHVDRPAVLHARQIVVGRPPSTDLDAVLDQLPRVNADLVITALRLVMNAPISIIFQEHDSEGLMAFGGGGTAWGWAPRPYGALVTLDQEKATQIIHVWQLLQTSPNIDHLRLPLRRWESSLLRASYEDRLIDAWVSLEAFLLGGQEGKLSYRAAVRLAELLGTNGDDRKVIYDATRISYKWRSKIVHALNSEELAKQHPLQETVRVTTERLRLALLKVLECPEGFEPKSLKYDPHGRGDEK